ncbi:hypothetical protein [Stenotrophomonas maltophilia]|uniref:hypothetical protein n=1 Tax=Stenotrophomonas maltophilia TaxID=40324 RepID=UPI00083F5952|nr:hypothetical protein [Stenotrophomonas maltophilia]MBY6279054.1 hypothetical protein [Stenotrophomonas maltophilia]
MLLFLLLAVSALKTQGAYDEVRELPDGQILIMRTLDWDLGDGTKERVTVHWLLQEDGRMRYDFDRQPPQTQEVHRRSCARQGMQPSRGVGMIAGEGTAHGYSCSSGNVGPTLDSSLPASAHGVDPL